MGKLIVALLFCGMLTGCLSAPYLTKYDYVIVPEKAEFSNELCTITLEPIILNSQLVSFDLFIENRSDKPIEVDWNKTLFIQNGQTNGGFMYEGIVYADRNNPRMPDIIFPKSAFKKNIKPNNMVTYISPSATGPYYIPGGWVTLPMTGGNLGAYVTIRHDGTEAGHRVSLDVTATEKSQTQI